MWIPIYSKAYIILQHETIRVGALCTPNAMILHYQNQNQHVGISKALRTQCDPQFTQCHHLYTQWDHLSTQCKPNAWRWNIGCVGSPWIGAHVGHLHFMLFVSISFALGSQREHSLQWNMGFTCQWWSHHHCQLLAGNQLQMDAGDRASSENHFLKKLIMSNMCLLII